MAYELYAQGQTHLAQVYFQATTFAGPFYVGLGTGGIPEGRDKTLANVTEVVGTGYSRASVVRDGSGAGWTVADGVATSPILTFTNTDVDAADVWTDADYAFLTLSPSGVVAPAILLATVELDETLILAPGDSKQIRFNLTLG